MQPLIKKQVCIKNKVPNFCWGWSTNKLVSYIVCIIIWVWERYVVVISIKVRNSKWLIKFQFSRNTISWLTEDYWINIILFCFLENIQSNPAKLFALIDGLRISCQNKIGADYRGSVLKDSNATLTQSSMYPCFTSTQSFRMVITSYPVLLLTPKQWLGLMPP